MTKNEFVYGVNSTTVRGRRNARRRELFYDWYQEHKNDEKLETKIPVVARMFGVDSRRVRHWFEKLGGYAKCDSEKDSG